MSDIALTAATRANIYSLQQTQILIDKTQSRLSTGLKVNSALDDAIATAVRDGSTIAIVSHAGWIRVAATILLGEPLEAAFDRSIGYARAAVVCVGDNQPVLRAWDVATLDDASVAR